MTLLLALAAQAVLFGYRLDLLDLWTDELVTLETVMVPIPDLLNRVALDMHPPLFFLLQHFWMKVRLPVAPAIQLRLLCVLFALAGTVAIDKFLARRLAPPFRLCFLAVWITSPCLLLYARMARSYSLQMLVVTVAAHCVWRLKKAPGRRNLALTAAAITAAFYTHYVTGAAVAAAVGAMLVRQRRFRELASLGGVVSVACLPLGWALMGGVVRWTKGGMGYSLTGGLVSEIALKAAFGTVSLFVGESLPSWTLLAGLAIVPAVAWAVLGGMRRERELAAWLVVLALVGFLGVARWVAYPFVPARLLFLLPFIVFFLVRGCETRGRAGFAVIAAVLVVSLVGVAGYFSRTALLNKGYAVPFSEIAARISSEDRPAATAVVCDAINTDFPAMQHYLPDEYRLLEAGGEDTAAAVDRLAGDTSVRRIWFIRNTHDVSPKQANSQAVDRLAATWQTYRHYYLPLSQVERWLARAVGVADPPRFFYEVAEFRR